MLRRLTTALIGVVAASTFAASTMTANATTIFFEDFDTDLSNAGGTSQLNFTGFGQFTVDAGSVDLIGSGGFGIACVAGGCVDLDGSTFGSTPTSNFVSTALDLGPGSYTLSFDATANQRNGSFDSFTVSVGTVLSEIITPTLGSDNFTTYAFTFDVASLVSASIVFFTEGPSDNIGAILDNVLLVNNSTPDATAPLPAGAPLMIAGILGLGFATRRRKL